MTRERRIKAFAELSRFFSDYNFDPDRSEERSGYEGIMDTACKKAMAANGWFVPQFLNQSVNSLGLMMEEKRIRSWLQSYPDKETVSRVAVIMAGNIPLVGFHDFLCVLITGNSFLGKLSSDDQYLIPAAADILISIEPGFRYCIEFTTGRISGFDAVIATGSNNSAGYFDYYFSSVPHIIRRNRNGVALLDGTETQEDMYLLSGDIFSYFGRGCRNISLLLVPENYDFSRLISSFESFSWIINHNKYNNNYTYRRSLLQMNSEKYMDNGFVILKEDHSVNSPVGVIHYKVYKSREEAIGFIEGSGEEIQCIVSAGTWPFKTFLPGQAQQPELNDYADGVDTIDFLLSLEKN